MFVMQIEKKCAYMPRRYTNEEEYSKQSIINATVVNMIDGMTKINKTQLK